jgi:hypothetical protein
MKLPAIEGQRLAALPDHDGYAVSDAGDVWSCRTTGRFARIGDSWHKLTPANLTRKNMRGGTDMRPMVNLPKRIDGRRVQRNEYVCRLVLAAFVGPPPDGHEACHNNGDPTDNRLANLRWDAHRENQRDMVRHGRTRTGENNARAKLTAVDVAAAIRRRARGDRPTDIARDLGVTYRHLWAVLSGKRWCHVQR